MSHSHPSFIMGSFGTTSIDVCVFPNMGDFPPNSLQNMDVSKVMGVITPKSCKHMQQLDCVRIKNHGGLEIPHLKKLQHQGFRVYSHYFSKKKSRLNQIFLSPRRIRSVHRKTAKSGNTVPLCALFVVSFCARKRSSKDLLPCNTSHGFLKARHNSNSLPSGKLT